MPALFKPSKANPPVMAPSPMMATDWRSSSPFILAATAMPKAAEIDVEECPVPKASYLLSLLFGKPLRPLYCRLVEKLSLLPVKIL